MKKIIYLAAIFIASFATYSCNSGTEELFNQSASERVTEAMEEAKKVLCAAPNGWLMKYYPSRTMAFGGYNVLVSFTEDGFVTAASELFDADKTSTSLYRLKEQAGPTLTIDTENEIFHLFSNPNSGYGDVGLGMEGDYEFTVLSAAPEKVVLKGKKSGNNIELTPFPAEQSWKDYLIEIKKSFSNIEQFYLYEYKVGGETFSAQRNGNNLTISYKDENGERATMSAPFLVNSAGMDFAEPITLGGKEVISLVYNSGEWKSDDGSVSLVGSKLSTYDAFMNKAPWFITYDGLGDYGKEIADKVRSELFPNGDNDFLVLALGNYLNESQGGLNFILEKDLPGYKDGEGTAGFMLAEIAKSGANNIRITTDTRATEVVFAMIDKSESFMDFVKLFMSFDSDSKYRIFSVEYDRPYNPSTVILKERGNEQNSIKMTCIGDNNAYFNHQYD